MLSPQQLGEWVRATYGPRHADRRVSDIGFAWLIDTQPDAYLDGDTSAMTWGGGPVIVVKRTGAVWHTGSNPMFFPLYEARTEEEFRRAMAAAMPQCDPDRPPETIPVTAPVPQPSPQPSPQGTFGAPYDPAFGPAYAPAPPLAGPEFMVADARNAVLVDASGVSFDQGALHVEFAWSEIHTVHHMPRGLLLMVGVAHANGTFYECGVGARRQARLREWTAQLAPVLGHYLANRAR